MEPVSPALEGRFFTTEPPGKPTSMIGYLLLLLCAHICKNGMSFSNLLSGMAPTGVFFLSFFFLSYNYRFMLLLFRTFYGVVYIQKKSFFFLVNLFLTVLGVPCCAGSSLVAQAGAPLCHSAQASHGSGCLLWSRDSGAHGLQ